MRQRVILVVVGMITLVAALRITEEILDRPGAKVVVDVPAGACPTGPSPDAVKCEVNAIRKANHLPLLHTNHRLRAAARKHANDMVAHKFFAHTSPSGSDVKDRVRAYGYLTRRHRGKVGENIAWGSSGYSTPASIVEAWMRSPPHRKVILSTTYREGGAGIVEGTPSGKPGNTYVMDLAVRTQKRARSADGSQSFR
jgi:hypothetical protein